MKILKYLGLILFVALSITACKEGADPEADTKLKKAGELHDGSLAQGNEVSKILIEAEALVLAAEAIIPTLDDEAAAKADSYLGIINEFKEEYKGWTNLLVEVPGHAHAHVEGGGHHHHDHSMDNASPSEILAKQEELKEYIDDIKERLTKAIEPIKTVVEENTVK